jgi:hypothetical protein
MNALASPVHPLFDPNSLYLGLRKSVSAETRLLGYLHWLISRQKGLFGPPPPARAAGAPAPWIGPCLDARPVQLVLLAVSPTRAPELVLPLLAPTEAALVLLSSGPQGNRLALTWARSVSQALPDPAGGEGRRARIHALLLEPEGLANLAAALDQGSPVSLEAVQELLRQALSPATLRENQPVAQLLAAAPQFDGERDAQGNAIFSPYPVPEAFERFPSAVLTVALVFEAIAL